MDGNTPFPITTNIAITDGGQQIAVPLDPDRDPEAIAIDGGLVGDR